MNDAADKALATRLSQALGSSYTLEGEIGRGGMGVVFSARDERLKRQVAVKVLPPELAFREEIRLRFVREAETAARLSHPHIVPIHSVGEGPDGLVYFVMAYVDGESLAAKLKRRDALPAAQPRRPLGYRQPGRGGVPDAHGRAAVPRTHGARHPHEAHHGARAPHHRPAARPAGGPRSLRHALPREGPRGSLAHRRRAAARPRVA